MNPDVSSALAVLQADPANPEALATLASLHPGNGNGSGVDEDVLAAALADARRFHRERGDFALCAQLIDLELVWTPGNGRRADLLVEKAHILDSDLLRESEAVQALERAIEAVPDHPAAGQALSQIQLVRANWERIAAKYLEDAHASQDKSLVSSLYCSVAEFYAKYRSDGQEAEEFLRRSVDADPRNRKAAMHLERLLAEKGRSAELLAFYGKRIEAAGSREDRAAAEVAAGDAAARLGQPALALEHYKRALAAEPAQPKALGAVTEALTGDAAWGELKGVYEAALRAGKRGESDLALLLQLAMILWKKLGQVDQAELYFRRLRKADARHPAMLDFYREYHTTRSELPQLLAILGQAQKIEPDPARRVQIGVEMAQAAEQLPQYGEKAIDLWKGLLRLQPRQPEAMAALKRLYTRTEKWNALLELLKDECEALPHDAVDDKVARYLDIVAIYRDRLSLDVMVINTYLNVLALKADHPTALAALAERYEAQGRWSDLIGILGRQADATRDAHLRVGLHRRVAQLWVEKFGKHQNAVSALEKILELDTSDVDARERLKDLYVRGRSWRPLLDVYRKELPFLPEDVRRAHLGEMARLAADRLGDAREAIALWNQALEIDDHDGEALVALSALYEREKRWPALVEILDRQRSRAVGDPHSEAALLEKRGAVLADKLGALPAAVEAYRRAQQLAPGNPRITRALREIYAQAGDFKALESLYAEQGSWDELCDTLSGLADRTADMTARTRLLERIADIGLTRLGQPERALKSYERILATDPHNRRAAAALVPLYRAAEKWPRLLATYEILLGYPDLLSEGERLEILAESRRICEERLGSKALAFQWCARAYEIAPTDPGVLADLERLAGDADEWAVLAGLYGRRAESLPREVPEKLDLLRRSLRIAVGRLYRPAEARRFAEEILQVVDGDDEAESALEHLHTQAAQWVELARVLRRREARTPDLARQTDLLFRIAVIEEEKLSDRPAAARTYGQIAGLDPGNARALRALQRVQDADGDYRGLADTLRREADLLAGDERADALVKLGETREQRLDDPDGAFAAFREALELDPVRSAAVAGLERLSAPGGARAAEIAGILAPFYERTESAPKLAAALETQYAAASGTSEKLRLLHRLVPLHADRLRDAAAAYRAALRLFEIDPRDGENRDRLVQYAVEAQALGELAELMRVVADGCDDTLLRRDLLVEIAELHEQRLGRSQDAEAVYLEILNVDPTHAGAYRALTRLYRDGERWSDLRSLVQEREKLTIEPGAKIDLLAQIAEIDESVLDDNDHAVATFQRMLELDPSDMRAYRALDRHYAARERWADLEDLLARQTAFADRSEAPQLAYRRSEIRFGRLGAEQVGAALDLLEGVVRTMPEHEGARRLLERALGMPEHRQRAARLLEPLYEASAAWARLVAVLEIEREARHGADAAALLARIAGLQESRLQARAAALATWRQVIECEPGRPGALVEIERIATALERFEEICVVYVDLAGRLDAADLTARADLLGRAARMKVGRLGDRPGAIELWRKVIDLDPSNLDTARPAASALEQLYAEVGDIARLVGVLRMQADWTEEVGPQISLLFRIASLQEKSLGDVGVAVATLRDVLEADPANGAALDHLERIFDAGAQHEERVEILRRRIELAADAAGRRELLRRIARIEEQDLRDEDEAVACQVAILDEAPDDVPALEELARLYERKGRHADRLEVLERRLALSHAVPERIEILRRVGALLSGPLAQPAEALERWQEILALAPGDAGALASLEYLLAGEGALRIAAAEALEAVYEAGGKWQRLAEVVGIFADAADDRRERIRHLLRLAGLEETRLHDTEAAFKSYARAIRDAVAEPELPGLLDAYERLGAGPRVPEVVALYREVSADVLDEGVQLRLDRFVAEASRKLGDRGQAVDSWRRVLDRAPQDQRALGALEALYRESDDTAALYEILLLKAELAADAKSERALRAQLGALADRLGRHDDAVMAWERVFEIRPGDDDAVAALDRLYAGAERWVDLGGLLGRLLDLGPPERQAVKLRFRLAEIESARLHDSEKALAHLRAVLVGDPDHDGAIAMLEAMLGDLTVQVPAAELLEPVYAGRHAWASLIRIDEIRLLQADDTAKRVAWTKRIARIHEEQLEDLDSAFRWYGRLFQESAADRWTRDQLLRLAGKLDRWNELGQIFAGYLGNEYGDASEVLEIVRLAAEIFDRRLGERDEARKYYRRLCEARPGDRPTAQVYEEALERWEEWQPLRDLLDEQAGRTADVEEKKTLLRRSARLDEERLGDPERAMATLRAILEIDPAQVEAAAELERLLRAGERWYDLGEHLGWLLGRADTDAERDAVAFRLADVHEKRLADLPTAVDRYEEILKRTPGHRGALAALERVILDADQRFRVAQILEPIYRASGELQKLVVILEAQLETVDEPARRAEILGEIGDIHGRLGRLDMAFEARRRAWLIDVASADALTQLEEAAHAGGTALWAPLAETLQGGAERAPDPDLQGHLLAAAARLYEERLRDRNRAIEAWRAALGARSDDVDAFIALERLLAQASRMTELTETLDKHAEVSADPGERKALTKRAAVLYEQALKQREKAIAAWRAVLEIDDADEEALDALGRLYVAGMAWRDLSGVYQRKIEIARDAAAARLLRILQARHYDEKLAEPHEAVSQLRAVLDGNPGDIEALDLLDRIFTREGQHAELVELLDQRAAIEANAAERDATAFRAARLCEQELSDPSEAISRYQQILTRTSSHDGAREALWQLAHGEDRRSAALAALEPTLRGRQEWDGLVELLELRLTTLDEPGPRFEVLAEIARIEETERGERKRAFDAWARAFVEEPTELRARRALEGLAKANADMPGLAAVYEERIGATFDADLQRSLSLRLAEICETALGDPARAADHLRKARELPGDEWPVLTALDRVLRSLGAWADLADVLAREAELSGDPGAQGEFLAQLGEVRRKRLDDAEGAIAAFREVVRHAPDHSGALAALAEIARDPARRDAALDVLEPLAEARGDFAELVALGEQRLTLIEDRSDRARALRRIAEVHEARLGDPRKALDALGRALADEPMPGQTLDEIDRVAGTGDLASEAARKIEATLAAAEPAFVPDLALRAARLHGSGEAGRPDAERLYRKVLDLDPENVEALLALEKHHRASGDAGALAGVLEKRAALGLDPVERRALLCEAAGLRDRLGEHEIAVADWTAVREAREGDAEALDALARLYETLGRKRELGEALEERARFAAQPAERASFYARVGALRAQAGDLDGAADAYREAIDSAPEDPALLAEVESLHDRRGDYPAVQQTLLRRLTGSQGPAHVDVLFRLAANAEKHLDDTEQAVGFLRQALDADPSSRQAFADIERILVAGERWYDLVEILGRHAEVEAAAGETGEELRLRVRVADVWEQRLDSADSAAEALEKVLERDPGNVAALLSVARLHEKSERWDAAALALERAAGVSQHGRPAAEIHHRMGKLLAAQERAEDAEAAYLRAIDADATYPPALDAFEQIARAAGDSARLAQVLELREAVAVGADERKKILAELAELFAGPLAQPAGAVPFLERLVSVAPDEVRFQERLCDALFAAGRVDDAERTLAAVVDRMKGRRGKDLARYQQRLAALAEARGDHATAQARYDAAHQIDPSDAATLVALGRFAVAAGDAEKARRYYRSLLLQSFDEKAAGIGKADVYLALGKLHLRAGEAPKARNMFERGLETDPKHEGLRQALAQVPK